jgi:hypothetical protein
MKDAVQTRYGLSQKQRALMNHRRAWQIYLCKSEAARRLLLGLDISGNRKPGSLKISPSRKIVTESGKNVITCE